MLSDSYFIVTMPFKFNKYSPEGWGYGDVFNGLKITKLLSSLEKDNVRFVLPEEIYNSFEKVCNKEDKKFIIKLDDCHSIKPTAIIFSPQTEGDERIDSIHINELLKHLDCSELNNENLYVGQVFEYNSENSKEYSMQSSIIQVKDLVDDVFSDNIKANISQIIDEYHADEYLNQAEQAFLEYFETLENEFNNLDKSDLKENVFRDLSSIYEEIAQQEIDRENKEKLAVNLRSKKTMV